jgi:hypothetical protein
MKSEDDPITDDEMLLRRVYIDWFNSPNAFEPRVKGRQPDTQGISFYREACLNDPSEVLATVSDAQLQNNGIVRVSVSFLKSLELSVQSKPTGTIKGHVVIPELNAAAYQADKGSFTSTKLKLAEEVRKDENIVIRPKGART